VSYAQVYTVATAGGDYTSVKDACDAAALVVNTNNRMLIEVYPGTYIEDPIVVPDYVTLFAPGRHEVTRIVPNDASSHAITIGKDCEVIGLRVKWAAQSDPGTASFYIPAGKYDIELHDCFSTNGDIGFLCSSNAGSIIGRQINVLGGTGTTGIQIDSSGIMEISDFMFTGSPTLTNLIKIDSGSLNITNVHTNANTTFTRGLWVDGGGTVHIFSAILRSQGAGIGIFNDGGVIHGSAVSTGFVTTGLQTVNGAEVALIGFRIDGSSTNHVVTAAGDTVLISGGDLDRSKLTLNASSDVHMSFMDTSIAGDEAMCTIGENATGLPGMGFESTFGEGDSYAWAMEVHQYAASEPSGSRFTSVTAAARSQTGSTFQFPAGAAAGDCIYIADPLPFPGIKMEVVTALVKDTNTDVICELWDGAAWVTATTMDRASAYPFTTRRKLTFETTGSAHVPILWT